jgi:hypothetical protein
MSHFSVKITVGDFCPLENLRAREISGQTRWCGELQNFRARRDVEHDAAPLAVESLQRLHGRGRRVREMHRQATERAVRMRGVSIHAPRIGLDS